MLVERGGTAEEYLCKHQHVWGENDRYFDRCAAGLGIIDAEQRLAKVKSGECKAQTNKQPADWELFQLQQFGPTLTLTCNPASPDTGFVPAMKTCPESFRMHFPCIEGDQDYEICTGALFGADVKKDGNIVPFHRLCAGHDVLRRMFECVDPAPHVPGQNKRLYALEWSNDHPGLPVPWNVVDWTMGVDIGAWGGSCTCPEYTPALECTALRSGIHRHTGHLHSPCFTDQICARARARVHACLSCAHKHPHPSTHACTDITDKDFTQTFPPHQRLHAPTRMLTTL